MAEEKPHLSATQISMFWRCCYQYMFRYMMGLKLRPKSVMLIGGAFHTSIEKNLTNVMEVGSLLGSEAVQDIARDALNERWNSEEVDLDPEEKKRGEAAVRGEAVDTTVSIAMAHHSGLAPHIDPMAVELGWDLDIKGYDYKLVGIFDILEKPLVRVPRIRETKSAARKPAPMAELELVQLTAYSARIYQEYDEFPDIAVDWVTKTKTPEIVTRHLTKNLDDVQGLCDMIETITIARERGIFPPTGLGKWWCGDRCGYAAKCKYLRRG